MTGIDADFYSSKSFKEFLAEPYTRLYHEAGVPGVQVRELSDHLVLVANGDTDLVANPPLVRV